MSDDPITVRDALDGGAPSLADNEPLAELAAAFDERGAYSAVLRAQAGGFPYPQGRYPGPEVVEEVHEAGILLPGRFNAVGIGLVDDDGPLVLLVYVHDDEVTAERNAEFLQATLETGHDIRGRTWSEVLTIDSVESQGRLVVAELRPIDGRAGRAYTVAEEADATLFTHADG